MPKVKGWLELPLKARGEEQPLTDWLCRELRSAILEGRLPPSTRLPSTRDFAAQYGVDGQRIVDEGSPFTSVYLLPQPHRTPDAMETTLAHLGNYLFHELTTPLGLRLGNLRHGDDYSGSGGPPAGPRTSSAGTG